MDTSKITYTQTSLWNLLPCQMLFFSILLHKDSKKFCSPEFKGIKYNLNVLSFDLTSPRIFTKIMKLKCHFTFKI